MLIKSLSRSDIMKLEEGIGEKLATFFFYQASFLSSVIMALVKGWKLALLCLISFPVTMTLVGVAGLVSSDIVYFIRCPYPLGKMATLLLRLRRATVTKLYLSHEP